MSGRTGFIIIAIVLIGLSIYLSVRPTPDNSVGVSIVSDTVIIRDTIHDTIPAPEKIYIHRRDTVWMANEDIIQDTTDSGVTISLPIERKAYRTAEYLAVIEGYRPELISMDIFVENKVITNTVTKYKPARIQFGIGIGVGYDPFQNKIHPTISAAIYIPIFTLK